MATDTEVAAGEAQPPAAAERALLPTSSRIALMGIFLIMLIGALYLARAVVLPVVLATLLTLTAAPLVRALHRRGVSPAVTAVLLVAALALVALGGASLLRAPIADMITHAPQIAQKVRDRFDDFRAPLNRISEATKTVTAPPDGTPPDPNTVTVVSQPNLLDWLLGTLADVGSTIIATLLLAPFLLASTETLKLKLIRLFPELREKKRSLRVLRDIEHRVSRFLVTIALINTSLGIVVGAVMWLLGMPNPLLWGVGAGLLNFVPYIGPLTGISLAAAVSLTIHPDLLSAALPPLAYAAVNAVEGTLVTPLTIGRRLSLSIVAVLVSVGLATWMWGIIGSIIAVPVLVVIKAFCDEFASLAQIGIFISAESEPAEEREEPASTADPTARGAPALVTPRPDHAL